ncbi:peptidyl-tRNA hydrolase, mitochondrial-like [Gossypium australe]|uniref:Peptidyl-tRNA hydrolase, mitochondrial-like n=1 Tax=Gossypium australe TaxID=47621 RepID=A0A5B6WC58_9ROSI|nr:peptidyl-tRNA hydrolase, mitochondrial-like [Gossypium australe]
MITRRCFCSSAPRPWLFVGLGNPGDKYKGTRHNVKLICITSSRDRNEYSKLQGYLWTRPFNVCEISLLFGDLTVSGFVGDAPLLLAKPQTYMNLSGESTGALAAYYKLPLNRVIVFHDDMDLPCGVLRLQDKGGHGSHNGYEWRMLKSVIYHFRGNREFARLRIGIGKPPGQMDPKAFLLQRFNASARERIDTALQEGVEGLKLLLLKGLTEGARRFNTEQKYKHIRLQTMPT